MVDLVWGYSGVAEVVQAAVGGVHAAAGGNAIGWVIHTGQPAGVVIHSTATQSVLQVINSTARLILSVIVQHRVPVRPQKGSFYLVAKDKSRDPSHQLSQEDQRQEHGIQLEHPWAPSAGGKASEQAEDDDDGPGADEHVRGVGGVIGDQGDVGAQHQLPPYSNCQQDGSCYPKHEGIYDEKGFEAGDHWFGLHSVA